MPEIIINGKKPLIGEIDIQGAKNSVLPILSATVLIKGISVIHNCPRLSDVYAAIEILNSLGCCCTFEGHTVTVDATDITKDSVPEELMREMRSSLVFLGSIIGRNSSAVISSPGGCELGPRPIDLHLSALRQLGVDISEKHGNLYCFSKELTGNEIYLAFPSVGATENIMLAASKAKGVTVLHNAAHEPEIKDLAEFLIKSGANITGAGTDKIVILGVSELHGAEHTVIPDRIVAATYMAAAAATCGNVTVKKVDPSHLFSVISFFKECGCSVKSGNDYITVLTKKPVKHINSLQTLVYPGFPTDAGPLAVAMLTTARGVSVFTENIFDNRFKYVDELKRLGADIKVSGNVAVIRGVKSLSGATCFATDLRAGAALVTAGLSAWGQTKVKNIHFIKRGYESITDDLKKLGADIYEK